MTVFVIRAPAGGQVSGETVGALRRARTVVRVGGTHPGVAALATNAVTYPPRDLLQNDELARSLMGAQGPVAVVLPGQTQWDTRAEALVVTLRRLGLGARLVASAGRIGGGQAAPEEDMERWAPQRPLLGWTVLVTRPAHQAPALARRFEGRGARAVIAPAIRIRPPADPTPLMQAVADVSRYDWVVFTSANAVAAVRDALSHAGRDARALASCRVATVGSATESALEALGIRADLVPPRFVAESLLQALETADEWQGRTVLLPRAAEARAVVSDGLARLGASVDIVEAYRTEPEERGAEVTRAAVMGGEVDFVTFSASSAVRAFRGTVGGLGRARAVAIGPVTARAAQQEGLPLAGVAGEQTAEGLVEACVSLTESRGG